VTSNLGIAGPAIPSGDFSFAHYDADFIRSSTSQTADSDPLVGPPLPSGLGWVGPRRPVSVAAGGFLRTARSVEFDAVVVVALLAPAADARQSRDAKAAAGATPAVDPRLTLLVDEAFRHGKAIGVVGADADAAVLGLSGDQAGVVVGDPAAVAAGVVEGLSQHRAWDRFTPSR
jgi:catalase